MIASAVDVTGTGFRGDTQQSITELGAHFMLISTTANLFGGGTTPEHQIYMLNLFKLPAVPVS